MLQSEYLFEKTALVQPRTSLPKFLEIMRLSSSVRGYVAHAAAPISQPWGICATAAAASFAASCAAGVHDDSFCVPCACLLSFTDINRDTFWSYKSSKFQSLPSSERSQLEEGRVDLQPQVRLAARLKCLPESLKNDEHLWNVRAKSADAASRKNGFLGNKKKEDSFSLRTLNAF